MTASKFVIGGRETRQQPNLHKSKFDPGQMEFVTFGGNLVYLGSPAFTIHWDYIDFDDAQFIWNLFDSTVGFTTGGIDMTLPPLVFASSYNNVTALFTMPVGNVAGDLVENFEITVYNAGATLLD
jgi:hypothetical protein